VPIHRYFPSSIFPFRDLPRTRAWFSFQTGDPGGQTRVPVWKLAYKYLNVYVTTIRRALIDHFTGSIEKHPIRGRLLRTPRHILTRPRLMSHCVVSRPLAILCLRQLLSPSYGRRQDRYKECCPFAPDAARWARMTFRFTKIQRCNLRLSQRCYLSSAHAYFFFFLSLLPR